MTNNEKSRSKYWCFTLNNYTEEDVSNVPEGLRNGGATYCVIGKEVGESGTRHLQGYVEFPKRLRFNQVRLLLGGRSHIEKRRGSGLEAADYCKKDNSFEEWGSLSKETQGRRHDLEALQTDLRANHSMKRVMDEHFNEFLKYERAIKAARLLYSEARDWDMTVVVYWGRTGAGKTRAVYDNLPSMEDIYVHPGGPWFDGYDGQPIALFDDFCGSEFKISYLLKLLDRYPMKVPIKGGFVNWAPREIYITSNMNPHDWYSNANSEHVAAMFRRITNKVEFL